MGLDVLKFEPQMALFAGESGMDVYRPLIEGAGARLTEQGKIALEVSDTTCEGVVKLLEENTFRQIKIDQDIAGKNRLVIAQVDPMGTTFEVGSI